MAIRQALIQQFLTALNKHSPTQIISLLALIGIETVLQEYPNLIFRDQVAFIKHSIQNTSPKEQPKSHDPPKRKERALTPKITESVVPTPQTRRQRPHVQRHHLDDQAMKMALSQQYDFDLQETQPTQPTYRQNKVDLRSPVSQIEAVASPKQSFSYLLEFPKKESTSVQSRKEEPQQAKQLVLTQDYENKLREIQQGLTKAVLVDYQNIIEEMKKNPTLPETSPEGSMQEQQIKDYIKLQQLKKQQNPPPQLQSIMECSQDHLFEKVSQNTIHLEPQSVPAEPPQKCKKRHEKSDILSQRRLGSQNPQDVSQDQSQRYSDYQPKANSKPLIEPLVSRKQSQLNLSQQTAELPGPSRDSKQCSTSNFTSNQNQNYSTNTNPHSQRKPMKNDSQEKYMAKLSVHTPTVNNLPLEFIHNNHTTKEQMHLHSKHLQKLQQQSQEQQYKVQVPQEPRKSESVFSFLPHNRTKLTNQSTGKRNHSPNGLMQMAEKLINSPIIRQVTLKSGDDVTPNSMRSEVAKEIQVSNFDSSQKYFEGHLNQMTESMSSNSSAFSLFQPNEELKSFFRKELIKDDPSNNDENLDPQVKYSNIFLKGRMGGSKVF